MMIKVFVCYRRIKGDHAVDRLCDWLEEANVEAFHDIEDIDLAADYRERVRKAVEQCHVQLVVITDTWLQRSHGGRRIDSDDDPVRFEIETALKKRIPIIPVLIDDAIMPTAAELPNSIKALESRNGLNLRAGRSFPNDFRTLRDYLHRVADARDVLETALQRLTGICEAGDWILARTSLTAALNGPELDLLPQYQKLLNDVESLVNGLESADAAFAKADFALAVAALETIPSDRAPALVAGRAQLAQLGKRLSDQQSLTLVEIRETGQAFSEIVNANPTGGRKIPGARELAELLQRRLKEAEYKDGIRLCHEARFDDAAVRFESLGDYKDARDRTARCRTWTEILLLVRTREWDEAKSKATSLLRGGLVQEPHALAVQRWCVYAKQFVPILEAMATGLVAEERVRWEGEASPYHVLRVAPTATIAECNALSYDLQSKPGGMKADELSSWGALRIVENRLIVDFSLYTVRDPASARAALERFFAFEAESSAQAVLERIRAIVDHETVDAELSRGRTRLVDRIAAALPKDAGVLYAMTRDYDTAMAQFLARAREAPHDPLVLHHLGLAACGRAHLDPDEDDANEPWEWVGVAWASVFADSRFWHAWWAQRRKVYEVADEQQVQSARQKLQRLWTEAIKSEVESDRGIAELSRIELSTARAVASRGGGIPVGPNARERAIIGPRGVALLGLEAALSFWIASFPEESLTRDSVEQKICIGFSRLAPSQMLFDDGRFEEAIASLSRAPEDDANSVDTFAQSNPGFASIADGRGPHVFLAVRRSLLQRSHVNVALAAVSEVPVNIDKAVGHWRQALESARWLDNRETILSQIRDIVVGRAHVLRNQEKKGRLDSLNDAVKLLQDTIDEGWDGPEERLKQTLVDSLLDRGIYLSNEYDMEREARQDATRAWGMAPQSLRATVVLCTASLHYARELYGSNKRDLASALLKEIEDRLSESERLFPGNADLATVSRTATEVRDLLGGEANALEDALKRLRMVAQETKSEQADSRLAQAMVHEAQSDFSRAVDLYWALVQESPADHGLRGKLASCYRMWFSYLIELGDAAEARRVVEEARERCPDSAALSDVFGTIGSEAESQW